MLATRMVVPSKPRTAPDAFWKPDVAPGTVVEEELGALSEPQAVVMLAISATSTRNVRVERLDLA
jgi:hypothetical protein